MLDELLKAMLGLVLNTLFGLLLLGKVLGALLGKELDAVLEGAVLGLWCMLRAVLGQCCPKIQKRRPEL